MGVSELTLKNLDKTDKYQTTAKHNKTQTEQNYSDALYEFNLSPPGQNGHLFADGIFKFIFFNQKFCIFIQI